MDIGVQIFGCLAECKKDPDEFFRRVAEAGYQQIETCILFDNPVKMAEAAKAVGNQFMESLAENLWKPEELPDYIRRMKLHGLQLSSVHVFSENPVQAADRMIDTALKNHITTYVINCSKQSIATEYKAFAEECNQLAGILKQQNIELWIHNSVEEIKAIVDFNGRRISALTAVLELCKETGVGVQADLGWVLYAGIDPVEYLQEAKEFIKSIHFKDIKKDYATRGDKDIFACLGDGALNTVEILKQIAQFPPEVTVLIDQDASDGDIMEDLAKSTKLLRGE